MVVNRREAQLDPHEAWPWLGLRLLAGGEDLGGVAKGRVGGALHGIFLGAKWGVIVRPDIRRIGAAHKPPRALERRTPSRFIRGADARVRCLK